MAEKPMKLLAQDSKLFDDFKADPLKTLKVMEQMLGRSLANITASDIELIKTFTPDEFQVFIAVSDRMKAMGIKNFKL
jgi:hypothetical protein